MLTVDEPDLKLVNREFKETLGYLRDDLTWLIENSGPSYTMALLVSCGCEMLAAFTSERRDASIVFADLLPDILEARLLSKRLFDALRNGLVHGFDTKHLKIDGVECQIYLSRDEGLEIAVIPFSDIGPRLCLGIVEIGKKLCARIDGFERALNESKEARAQFMKERQPPVDLNTRPADLEEWNALLARRELYR